MPAILQGTFQLCYYIFKKIDMRRDYIYLRIQYISLIWWGISMPTP